MLALLLRRLRLALPVVGVVTALRGWSALTLRIDPGVESMIPSGPGVSFSGVSAPVLRWSRTEGYTAFSSSTHLLTLPRPMLIGVMIFAVNFELLDLALPERSLEALDLA